MHNAKLHVAFVERELILSTVAESVKALKQEHELDPGGLA